jgi:hypothetical protein
MADTKEVDAIARLSLLGSTPSDETIRGERTGIIDSDGSFWSYLREDAKKHPALEDQLHRKLIAKLAENPLYNSRLKEAAAEVLKNFGLDDQGQKISKLRKRQMSGDAGSTFNDYTMRRMYDK